jgi:hypothetical protein
VQEEWDAIPLESSDRPSGTIAGAAEAAAAAQPLLTVSYDEALAQLAAADMSDAAARVVLYEAPASCFARILHCFSRPSLQIQNAEEELRLPFLLALTPFDRCRARVPRHAVRSSDALFFSSNTTHMAMISTFYSKITASTRAIDRIGRCTAF